MRQSLIALQKETARIIYKKMEKPEMVDEESLTIIHGSFSDVITNLQSEVEFLRICLQKERAENRGKILSLEENKEDLLEALKTVKDKRDNDRMEMDQL